MIFSSFSLKLKENVGGLFGEGGGGGKGMLDALSNYWGMPALLEI